MSVTVDLEFRREDPKSTLAFELATNIQLLKDDEQTSASVYVGYNKPPETVKELFAKYDTVITVGDPESDRVKPVGLNSARFLHEAVYPVRVYSVDKTSITAKKMVWQLVNEVWRIIAATSSEPLGNVQFWHTLGGQKPEDKNEFSPPLLCRCVRVYVRFLEVYV